jgi:hypothetical protein
MFSVFCSVFCAFIEIPDGRRLKNSGLPPKIAAQFLILPALSFLVFSVFFLLDSAGRQFPLSDSHSSSFRTARIREKIVFSASRWRSLRAVQRFGCFPAGQGSAACELLFVVQCSFLCFSRGTQAFWV